MGDGIYRIPVVTDVDTAEAEDAALEDGELEAAESEGFIYAFTFPDLIHQQGSFPIKIGMTVNDVQQRVMSQCKGSAIFDHPTILGQWTVNRVGFVESAVHKVLASRGKWRETSRARSGLTLQLMKLSLFLSSSVLCASDLD